MGKGFFAGILGVVKVGALLWGNGCGVWEIARLRGVRESCWVGGERRVSARICSGGVWVWLISDEGPIEAQFCAVG